ncbi:reverse transcriptase-like protein [Bacillus marinisedimentorum]|uniref:reverse transcriptase-like protein n=1 Tax=Bacillus marinisedimentorum TaxID=1821260 RepID=UPI0007E291E2|nr:reverse transcriptase-like protein [Bacillus marinisedimentorum]
MMFRIEWLYMNPKRKREVEFISGWISGDEVLQLADDIIKTGRTKEIIFVDEKDVRWNRKEMERLLAQVEEEPHDIQAFFDGGYDKKAGKASAGMVIYYKKDGKTHRIRRNASLQELSSNNEAEYAALWNLVVMMEEAGIQHQTIGISGDSAGAINQASGEWPCYDETLNTWLDRIEQKLEDLGLKVRWELIDRKKNKEAHELAHKGLEGTLIDGSTIITG